MRGRHCGTLFQIFVEKRDYGSWLHVVLHAFHASREAPAPAPVEIARLHELARAQQVARAMARADFLPFAASFASFAPRYVAWLHARDAQGVRCIRGEDDLRAKPASWDGTELRGVIDRVDETPASLATALQLIDY